MTEIFVWKMLIDEGSVNLFPYIVPEDVRTLDDVSFYLPKGAYTTFRTYHHNYVLNLDDHLARLENTAKLMGKNCYFNMQIIHSGISRAIRRIPKKEDVRIRITVPLGGTISIVFISLEYLRPLPISAYRDGVKLTTCRLIRDNPKAKVTEFLEKSVQIKKSLGRDINDALMVGNDNRIKEGISSNFFAVKKNEIWTEEKDVLSGITRSIVLNEAKRAGLIIHVEGILLEQLPEIDEAFITSSSRGVLPVYQIDDVIIGKETPGDVTFLLMEAYESYLEKNLEEI